MADGVISADELEYIRGEAKRLHLSVEEVNALIRQIHNEVEEKSNLAALPIHKIAAKPELAAEHYKTLISNIRQLGMLMDPAEFEQMRQTNSRLTPDEIALWEKIRA
jgi:hypothetical protein